ncbi:MAG: cation:proton antiporter, partial [Halochromatium sp.]|uniref:cation:proton antiporter domain-containing protein n=1 Tax=Halochromatium sp. TaxID=2049430 RepID=UPI0039791B81
MSGYQACAWLIEVARRAVGEGFRMFDIVWIALAFALGFGARHIGLPPLVGYLVAGFVLHAFGAREDALVEELAHVGITLLLFTIGLKLKLK